MEKNSQQGMNVARPRGRWKPFGWVALAAFLILGLLMLTHRPGQSDERNIGVGIIAVFAFTVGMSSLVQFLAAWASPVYYWNGEGVKWKRLRRERSMRWDEVSSVRVKESSGELTYVLTDTWGRRLTLDIKSLGGDHPLHLLLKQRLHRLLEGETDAAQAAVRTEFPVRLLGVSFGTFILGEDSLTAKGPFRTREMPLSDLCEVRQTTRRHEWETYREAELVWKDGSKTKIPHFTTGLFRLLESLRSRASRAVWYHARGPEPRSKAAKIAFWRYRLDSLRKSVKTVLWSGTAVFAFFGALLTWRIARRGWEVTPDVIHVLKQAGILFAVTAALMLWTFVEYPRRLRRLQERLAAVEGQIEDGEPESAVSEEDRG